MICNPSLKVGLSRAVGMLCLPNAAEVACVFGTQCVTDAVLFTMLYLS